MAVASGIIQIYPHKSQDVHGRPAVSKWLMRHPESRRPCMSPLCSNECNGMQIALHYILSWPYWLGTPRGGPGSDVKHVAFRVSNKKRRRAYASPLSSPYFTGQHPLCQSRAHRWASAAWDTWRGGASVYWGCVEAQRSHSNASI